MATIRLPEDFRDFLKLLNSHLVEIAFVCLALIQPHIQKATAAEFLSPSSMEDLATNSDSIVIGRVKGLLLDQDTARARVTLDILEALKGNAVAGKDLTFESPCYLGSVFSVSTRVWIPIDYQSNEVCCVFLKTAARKVPWEPHFLEGPNTLSYSNFEVYSIFDGKMVRPPLAELGPVPFNSTPLQLTFEYYDSKLLVDWTNRLYKKYGTVDKDWKPLSQLKEKVLSSPQDDK
jgi:hypothetical protein